MSVLEFVARRWATGLLAVAFLAATDLAAMAGAAMVALVPETEVFVAGEVFP